MTGKAERHPGVGCDLLGVFLVLPRVDDELVAHALNGQFIETGRGERQLQQREGGIAIGGERLERSGKIVEG